jgi:hypothetical protein
VFRNVGILNSDAGELPRRKHTIYTYIEKYKMAARFWLAWSNFDLRTIYAGFVVDKCHGERDFS